MKKQSFVVDHGTYPFDVLVCIGLEHGEVCKLVSKKLRRVLTDEEREKLWMSGKGRTAMLSEGQTVLLQTLRKDKADFHASLAHEIFHAVEFLFNRIDLQHKVESGEAFAYQIQYLTGSIYEKIK